MLAFEMYYFFEKVNFDDYNRLFSEFKPTIDEVHIAKTILINEVMKRNGKS